MLFAKKLQKVFFFAHISKVFFTFVNDYKRNFLRMISKIKNEYNRISLCF